MTHCRTGLRFPFRTRPSTCSAGIQAQTGYGHENVALTDVYGNPLSITLLSVGKKTAGRHRSPHQSGFPQHVGNGARAVVSTVIMPRVPPAPFVWHALQAVSGRNRALYHCWCSFWRISHTVPQQGRSAMLKMVAYGALGSDLVPTTSAHYRQNSKYHIGSNAHYGSIMWFAIRICKVFSGCRRSEWLIF
jgi:hypothetical protein